MPTIRLTARTLETLPPAPPGRQVDYFDAGANLPGFGVRLSPKSRRTWFLLYRANGRLRRLTLGTFPPMSLADAREAGRRALLRVQVDNADPATAKRARRTALTFAQLADHYVEQWAKPRKRSWRDDARRLRTICHPRWGSHLAAELTRTDVRKLLGEMVTERGAVSANRLHSLLSKVFRWAVAQGYLEANPMGGLPKPAGERSRDRVLSEAEVRALWERLNEIDTLAANATGAPSVLLPEVALWLKLRLLTAQRGQEVAGMEWAQVDLQKRLWELPGTLMKNGQPHVVPLSPLVLKLLKAQREAQPSNARYVLEGGRSRKLRLGVIAKVGGRIPDFRPHDLRRTAATGMGRLGVPRFIIDRVLAHVDRSVGGIYDRWDYVEEKRDALERWSRELQRIVAVHGRLRLVKPR